MLTPGHAPARREMDQSGAVMNQFSNRNAPASRPS
jgi:hypothetical protein